MEAFESDTEELGAERYWAKRGFDVTDEAGAPLRCLPHVSRQLYAASKELLLGALLTLNGSGRRAPQSLGDWSAALEAEAARFRPFR